MTTRFPNVGATAIYTISEETLWAMWRESYGTHTGWRIARRNQLGQGLLGLRTIRTARYANDVGHWRPNGVSRAYLQDGDRGALP